MIRNYSVDKLREAIQSDIAAGGMLDQETTARIARVVLAGLQRRHGGSKLYVPVDYSRAYPLTEILQAYAHGDSPRAICRRYRISRSMFYRLLNST